MKVRSQCLSSIFIVRSSFNIIVYHGSFGQFSDHACVHQYHTIHKSESSNRFEHSRFAYAPKCVRIDLPTNTMNIAFRFGPTAHWIKHFCKNWTYRFSALAKTDIRGVWKSRLDCQLSWNLPFIWMLRKHQQSKKGSSTYLPRMSPDRNSNLVDFLVTKANALYQLC